MNRRSRWGGEKKDTNSLFPSMTDKHLKYFFKQPQKKDELQKTQQVKMEGTLGEGMRE